MISALYDCPSLPQRPLYIVKEEKCYYADRARHNYCGIGEGRVIFTSIYNIRKDDVGTKYEKVYIDSQIVLPCLIKNKPVEAWSHIFIHINVPDMPEKLCRNHHGNTWYECGIYNMKKAINMFIQECEKEFNKMEEQ